MVWGRAKLSGFQVKPGKEEDSGQNISSALRAAQNNKFSEIALALSVTVTVSHRKLKKWVLRLTKNNGVSWKEV